MTIRRKVIPVSSAEGCHTRSLALHVGRGARQDLDKMGLGIGVAFKTLADGLAQMVERGFAQRRQRTAFAAFTALAAYALPPAIDALAECTQPIKHGVDNLAIGLEIGAAFFGEGQRRIDDAGARAVPFGSLLFEPA
jgi:hypothetical protein